MEWLNGWAWVPQSRSVLIGTGMHCVGCGTDQGVTTVAFPEDFVPPDRLPDWPFTVDDCPVHYQRDRVLERGLQEIAAFLPKHWCTRRAAEALR
jgi:hypothetical protein